METISEKNMEHTIQRNSNNKSNSNINNNNNSKSKSKSNSNNNSINNSINNSKSNSNSKRNSGNIPASRIAYSSERNAGCNVQGNPGGIAQKQIWELKECISQTVTVHGAVCKIRKMRDFAFVLLRTCGRVVQCVYSQEEAAFALEELSEECCIRAVVFVREEPRSRSGFDLALRQVKILSAPAEHSPVVISNRGMDVSLETLLNWRPVTLRNQKEAAIFKIQEALVDGMRGFLKRNHFTEIHTPKLGAEGAEGGANIFRLDYFGREACLAQSPQFYKQMMVGVYERVFEIGPVFRAERHDTSRHLNEYTGVDFEMGFIESFEELMAMETGMLQAAMNAVQEQCPGEIALLGAKIPKITEIPCIKFREAKELLGNSLEEPDFDPEEEKRLCHLVYQETGSEFVFVTHYPSAKRPFYAMDDPANPQETQSFDLLFRGMEVTTGGQRIHSYREQTEKMLRRGMQPEHFQSYLMIHRYGMPPHGGLGLGLERLTSRLLEQDNVRRSSLFPRDIHRLTP